MLKWPKHKKGFIKVYKKLQFIKQLNLQISVFQFVAVTGVTIKQHFKWNMNKEKQYTKQQVIVCHRSSLSLTDVSTQYNTCDIKLLYIWYINNTSSLKKLSFDPKVCVFEVWHAACKTLKNPPVCKL